MIKDTINESTCIEDPRIKVVESVENIRPSENQVSIGNLPALTHPELVDRVLQLRVAQPYEVGYFYTDHIEAKYILCYKNRITAERVARDLANQHVIYLDAEIVVQDVIGHPIVNDSPPLFEPRPDLVDAPMEDGVPAK